MKILIGCEESQAVTIAMRQKGHEAYSCDIQECSGGHPEWHICNDIIKQTAISGGANFFGGHPTCRFLTNSGVRWLISKNPKKGFVWNDDLKTYYNPVRWAEMVEGASFFKNMYNFLQKIGKGYLENPVMHKYALKEIGVKYTQIIQPWMFGHTTSKATCLWIVGLPKLKPTNIVPKEQRTYEIHKMPPGPQREKLRSKTFPGIASAMADQWG